MAQKNYNKMALQGWDVDDMEVVEQFGLDPALAYTPELNDVMLDKMRDENYQGYVQSGMSEAEAKSKADGMRTQASNQIQELLNQ